MALKSFSIDAPHPVDVHVGRRIRQRRSLLGMPQEKLADFSGVTFQQVQKYESGKNRVSASRLYEFAKLLEVPVGYFFEGLDVIPGATSFGLSDQDQDGFSNNNELPPSIMQDSDALELVRTYYSLKDPNLRRELLKFLKQMAATLSTSDKK
jgi:transcriptional regulator with XRE-family HTH domain